MRMLVPDDAPLSFVDLIRGEVSAPRPDDQVLLKGDGFPTYHLAVVVDDGLMEISHVVRGEEWISSTPKHLLLADWLGFPRPAYAHMPLLRNVDKSKISKRKNPAARLTWFVEQGYLPEALLNFLGLLGYSLPSQQEVFSLQRDVGDASTGRGSTRSARSSTSTSWAGSTGTTCASWRPTTSPAARCRSCSGRAWSPTRRPRPSRRSSTRSCPLVQTRVTVLSELPALVGFLFVPEDAFAVDEAAAAKALGPGSADVLRAAADALEPVQEWTTETVQAAVDAALLEGLGLKRGKAYLPLRAAVCGAAVAPPLPESMALLGRDRTLRRLRAAAER